MKSHNHHALLLSLLLFVLILNGCGSALPGPAGQESNGLSIDDLFPSIVSPTPTPFQPVPPTPSPTLTPTATLPPPATPAPVQTLNIWLDPAMPPALVEQIRLPQGAQKAQAVEQSNVQIGPLRGGPPDTSTWVYAIAAAFPTLPDGIALEEIRRAWRGEAGSTFTATLLMAPETQAAFAANWGPAGPGRIKTLPAADLLDAAWAQRAPNGFGSLAIIPFEVIEPRWKVLRVDGVSPMDQQFDSQQYPLAVWFGVSGSPEAVVLLQNALGPGATIFTAASNRDPAKMTTLVMTGVTALARATGARMDSLGATYPARDIRDWLVTADLTHISNEVSFTPDCPLANPYSTSVMFCSRPEYIELLEYIGTDIVELSGNHNKDWGVRPFDYSLNMYHERDWTLFAGGENIEAARRPAIVEHNGNRLAFIGCNPVGPGGVFATASESGVASCGDYGWILDEVRRLRSEGYLPIVTLQYFEIYVHFPSDHQERNFRALAEAGAVIVSGSQAHFPQYMEFHEGSFIHYGLGNLFFDQMDIPVPGTRREFVDRHIFYNGKHIQTELLTALLEDYARPRPMTQEERDQFLIDIFRAKGW